MFNAHCCWGRNFSPLTALWSHIIVIWVAWPATQEPSGYLSSEFPVIYHVYCHTIHLLQKTINISAEVIILDIVQVLVSDSEDLAVNHTFSVLQNLSSQLHKKALLWLSGHFLQFSKFSLVSMPFGKDKEIWWLIGNMPYLMFSPPLLQTGTDIADLSWAGCKAGDRFFWQEILN